MGAPRTGGGSSTSKAARPAPTFDRLSKKKPVTRRVPICLDPELADALVRAELLVETCLDEVQTFRRASVTDDRAEKALDDARAQLDSARAAAAEETIEVVFESIGRNPWDALLDEHPATAKQVEEAKKAGLDTPQYDETTLWPAAIAACAVSPEMSVDQVKTLFEDGTWNKVELLALWLGALQCNQEHRIVDLGKG